MSHGKTIPMNNCLNDIGCHHLTGIAQANWGGQELGENKKSISSLNHLQDAEDDQAFRRDFKVAFDVDHPTVIR